MLAFVSACGATTLLLFLYVIGVYLCVFLSLSVSACVFMVFFFFSLVAWHLYVSFGVYV
jgi:hypothetical protein